MESCWELLSRFSQSQLSRRTGGETTMGELTTKGGAPTTKTTRIRDTRSIISERRIVTALARITRKISGNGGSTPIGVIISVPENVSLAECI